jgi:hypothetical protein
MDGLGPDTDVGFWSMSAVSAEQLTVQIRTVLDRAWEFIALAYKGRAFIALGYPNWDAYVDARFGDPDRGAAGAPRPGGRRAGRGPDVLPRHRESTWGRSRDSAPRADPIVAE